MGETKESGKVLISCSLDILCKVGGWLCSALPETEAKQNGIRLVEKRTVIEGQILKNLKGAFVEITVKKGTSRGCVRIPKGFLG